MSHKHSSERPRQEDAIARTPKKKGGSIVENISLLIMMIIVTYLIGSQITFKITTKTGEWYEYIVLLVLGILSVIVNIALIKKVFILLFVHR